MRKVTEKIARALLRGEKCAVGNTTTNGECVWLHGNLIAMRLSDCILVSLAGWNTPTTRERVNGILEIFGQDARIVARNFEPVLIENGHAEIIQDLDWIKFDLNEGKK